MAATNFPDSPVSGQIFSGSMVNWQWNGTVWSPIAGVSSLGMSSDSIWDAKGDLVVGTGANTASRLAVSATSGNMLVSDSLTSTGLKWAKPYTLNHPFNGWHYISWTIDSTNTTPQAYGTGTCSVQGTPTSTDPTSSRLRNVSYVSAATTGSDAGVFGNTNNFFLSHDLRIIVWAGVDTLTNIRFAVGITTSIGNILGGDDGANGECAWFRYSTNAGDTTWKCLTSNDTAGGPTITDTGITVTTGTKIFEIHKTASEIKFFLDNVLVATHTTDIPDNSATCNVLARARTLANAAATVHFVQASILTRLP